MITLNAMACAGLYRLPDGEWTLHSRFSQAINFCRPDGELLTFFRYGKGMGPSGVLLSTTNFSRVSPVSRWIKRGNRLCGRGITLHLPRELRLQITVGDVAPVPLSFCAQQTGLGGSLNQPLSAIPVYSRISAELDRWLEGQQPDWHWLLGRGLGLTPSGDDMLTGMMAVLSAAGFFGRLREHHFLPPVDQLTWLTTSVSCSYLNSARLGEFSTPVLRVLRDLQARRDPCPAIRRLLRVGHTSGADILVGMVIAQRWLQAVDSRGMHARSGNNTYIYSGG